MRNMNNCIVFICRKLHLFGPSRRPSATHLSAENCIYLGPEGVWAFRLRVRGKLCVIFFWDRSITVMRPCPSAERSGMRAARQEQAERSASVQFCEAGGSAADYTLVVHLTPRSYFSTVSSPSQVCGTDEEVATARRVDSIRAIVGDTVQRIISSKTFHERGPFSK